MHVTLPMNFNDRYCIFNFLIYNRFLLIVHGKKKRKEIFYIIHDYKSDKFDLTLNNYSICLWHSYRRTKNIAKEVIYSLKEDQRQDFVKLRIFMIKITKKQINYWEKWIEIIYCEKKKLYFKFNIIICAITVLYH